jgi:probable phosphoglycerate mutase
MKLILIRHADPDYANDSLTEKGHKQAELLGKAMKNVQIDEVYVSPMGRAALTAEYIVKEHEISPVTLPWIHELNGNYKDELWSWNYHGCDLHANVVNWDLDNWQNNVPYGEHMKKVAEEFYCSFDDFMEKHGYVRDNNRYRVVKENNSTVVFVCHAGLISTLLSKLINVPLPIVYSHFEISPSSRTELVTQSKDEYAIWRMETMNDMSHADNLRAAVQQTGMF